jgi:hypothetical protein
MIGHMSKPNWLQMALPMAATALVSAVVALMAFLPQS